MSAICARHHCLVGALPSLLRQRVDVPEDSRASRADDHHLGDDLSVPVADVVPGLQLVQRPVERAPDVAGVRLALVPQERQDPVFPLRVRRSDHADLHALARSSVLPRPVARTCSPRSRAVRTRFSRGRSPRARWPAAHRARDMGAAAVGAARAQVVTAHLLGSPVGVLLPSDRRLPYSPGADRPPALNEANADCCDRRDRLLRRRVRWKQRRLDPGRG